jgi:hypothetical protein
VEPLWQSTGRKRAHQAGLALSRRTSAAQQRRGILASKVGVTVGFRQYRLQEGRQEQKGMASVVAADADILVVEALTSGAIL